MSEFSPDGYVVMFRDETGRQRKRSAATMAEARTLKAALVADVARGEFVEESRLRFDEYARDWIAGYQGRTTRGIRLRTIEEYRRDLEREAIPYFGRMRLAEIHPRHVKAFAAAIAGMGQLLSEPKYLGDWGWAEAIALASGAKGEDPFGYRSEAVTLMRLAQSLSR